MTTEQFDVLWSINPSGDPKQTLDYLNTELFEHFNGPVKDYKGVTIDEGYFTERYREYSDWWDREFGRRDPKYVSKVDRKADIYTFAMKGMVFQQFASPKKERDYYLFGDISDEIMKKKVKEFKNKLKYEKHT